MKSILLIAFFAVCLSINIDETEFHPEFPEVLPITEEMINATFAAMVGRVDIVGGTVVASPADYPFQASYMTGTNLKCGGSILSEWYILTAAHCVSTATPTNEQVSVGSLRYGSTAPQVRRVVRATRHPSYSASNIDYDVAILELNQALVMGNNVRPVKLETSNSQPAAGEIATVTGWGTTSEGGSISQVLREVQIPVTTDAFCKGAYGNAAITPRMVCAYQAPNGGKDSCQGDSGGPAVVYKGQEAHQFGIVSWGQGCARAGYPGVYTRVSAVHDFICSRSGVC